MPKRGIISAILTALGVWLLVNFKTPSEQGLSAFGRQTHSQSRGARRECGQHHLPVPRPPRLRRRHRSPR